MKIKKTRIFFLYIGFVIAELLPFSKFFIFITFKPMEACEQNISRTAESGSCFLDHRLCRV